MIASHILFPLVVASLLITLVIGLTRAVSGPALHDRVVAVQLLSTVGVAKLLVLATVTGASAFMDVALVLALLAAVLAAALTRREVSHD